MLFSMMAREYGRIVHISSVTGTIVGIPGSTVYGTAKAGMLGMTRSLAIEHADQNIRVNCVCPGPIETPMTEAAQTIIDKAVQLFGGLGVTRGIVVERLYREIRPLRIYEGTTEIQRLIISRGLLRDEGSNA